MAFCLPGLEGWNRKKNISNKGSENENENERSDDAAKPSRNNILGHSRPFRSSKHERKGDRRPKREKMNPRSLSLFYFVLQAVSECLKNASGQLGEKMMCNSSNALTSTQGKRDTLSNDNDKSTKGLKESHKKRHFKDSRGFLYMKKAGKWN